MQTADNNNIIEQVRLRDMLDVAAAEAETVKRLVESHRRHAKLRSHLAERGLN